MRQNRSVANKAIMEALEGRELFSMAAKLPVMELATPVTPAVHVEYVTPVFPTSWNTTGASGSAVFQQTSPTNLTVLPVKTQVVVGETAGGVLTVISGTSFHLINETGPGQAVYGVINWGDGTYEAATMTRAGQDILVTGYHAYTKPGFFHAIVTLVPYSSDPLALVGPPTDIANTLFTVTLNAGGGQTLKVRNGQSFSGTLASIANIGAFPKTVNAGGDLTIARAAAGNNPAAALKATIVWGDGTVTTGFFKSNKSGGYDIVGSHKFPGEGTYRVRVLIDVAYNGGPFAQRLMQMDGLALVGNVPGNVPWLPTITYPLTKFSMQAGVTGQLATGLVAVGGETTGYEVRGATFTYELEFASPALKAKADALSGKTVAVGGTVTIVPGVEVGQRRILLVSVLEQVA